jgi:hypothetical protein
MQYSLRPPSSSPKFQSISFSEELTPYGVVRNAQNYPSPFLNYFLKIFTKTFGRMIAKLLSLFRDNYTKRR